MLNCETTLIFTTEKATPCIRAIALISTGRRRNVTDVLLTLF